MFCGGKCNSHHNPVMFAGSKFMVEKGKTEKMVWESCKMGYSSRGEGVYILKSRLCVKKPRKAWYEMEG